MSKNYLIKTKRSILKLNEFININEHRFLELSDIVIQMAEDLGVDSIPDQVAISNLTQKIVADIIMDYRDDK